MKDHDSKRNGKRIREDDGEDYNLTLAPTEEEIPAFFRVLVEALKRGVCPCPYLNLKKPEIAGEMSHRNWLQLFNIIFSVDRQPGPGSSNSGTCAVPPPSRTPGSGGQKLQLCVETKMPSSLYAGESIKGEGGSVIYVILRDSSSGSVVRAGPTSAAKLNVVVLEGDFYDEISDGWEHDSFKSRQVKERVGKPPLLVGAVQVKLEGGVGTVGDLSFTDNSSWTRSKHFRLGLALDSGFSEGVRVMEAKTNEFRVKDKRGKAYEKRFPPALDDEVWRLRNIAKGGTMHKSLVNAAIRTVEDLTRLHAKDPQRLRTILGKGMTETMWAATLEHAMSLSPPGDKLYVYFSDGTKSCGVIFNHIHVAVGFISGRQVEQWDSLDHHTQKKKAYENWDQVVECDEQFLCSITTPMEMQDCPAEQASSINHYVVSPTQTSHTPLPVHQIHPDYAPAPAPPHENHELFDEDDFARLIWSPEDEPQPLPANGTMRVKAVVGWVKIKAAFKWGMMVSIAAKKRARLVEVE